jgi:hypothetical protein
MRHIMLNVPTLGKQQVVSPVDAFILDVRFYIDILRPKDYFIFREDFDPNTYFITSGDAIKKTHVMIEDLQQYEIGISECITTMETYSDTELELITVIKNATVAAKQLLTDLETAKGENCFLETEWDSHLLYVVPKNPRAR